jgi:hypothetical protein
MQIHITYEKGGKSIVTPASFIDKDLIEGQLTRK